MQMNLSESTIRVYLKRIIDIKRTEIPALQAHAAKLINALSPGTYRSKAFPGIVVAIRRPGSTGGNTNWKSVVEDLADTYNIPADEIRRVARTHRTSKGFATANRLAIKANNAKNPRGIIV